MRNIVTIISLIVVVLGGAALLLSTMDKPAALTLELSQELKQAKLQAAKTLVAKETALTAAKLETALKRELNIQSTMNFYQDVKKYSLLAAVSVVLTAALVLSLAYSRRLSTHTIELDEHVNFPVRNKDLKDSSAHVTAYLATKQAAALADNRQEAFQMFVQLAQTAAALNRSHPSPTASAPAALPEGQAVSSGSLPAFRDILNTLEPGDPMVLGFEPGTGKAITGGFHRIYSCGIFGVSGSGKTTGLYSIIAQSLLLYPEIKYMVIDPHADRPEGLTKGLPKTAHFEHLDALNVRPGLTRFVQELDNRLKTVRTYTQEPYVLLIDELPVIMKSSQGQAVEAVLGRIASEGRKVACFALISGQDTRLKAAGGNRDLLTSQIAYNLRKKQARYLFDDSEIVGLHKVVRESKEPGLCVFNSTDDIPILMKQPFCTPADVLYVESLLVSNSTPAAHVTSGDTSQVNVEKSVESVECPVETEVEPVELDEQSSLFLEKIREVKESQQWSLGELSRRSGVDKGLLSKLLNGKEKLTPGVMENLKTLLNTGTQHDSTPSNVIPFRK